MSRPKLHFTPPKGWCNDPNGLVFDGNYYHLFYQHHPHSLEWGPMHWGHARSRDLMEWEHLPIALAPDEQGGIFSGSAVMDGNQMVLLYTYHADDGTESQAIARSIDSEFTVFEKYAGNPVIPNPGWKDFRDPKLFLHDDKGWHMALAAGDRVLFYRSPDLIAWEKTGEFGAPDCPVHGLWECPDLFALTSGEGVTKWVLVFSLGLPPDIGGGKTMYFTGAFDGNTFAPDSPIPLPVDNGSDFYAGVTFWGAPDNRRIMLAWLNNWAYAKRSPDTLEWRGQMSLPRELALIETADGHRLSGTPIIPAEYVQTVCAGEREVQIVSDTYSLELFVPDLGITITQALF